MNENIIIGIDSRPAEQGGEQVVRKLEDIKRGADRTGGAMDRAVGRMAGIGRARSGIEGTGRAIERMGGAASRADREVEQLRRELANARRDSERFGSSLGDMGASLGKLGSALAVLKGAFAALGIAYVARLFVQATDTFKGWESQVRLSQNTVTSFNTAWKNTVAIANETRLGMEASVTLYAKIAQTANEMGYSTTEATRTAITFAKALKINGSTTEEAAAATRQFTQALGRGVLKGDEFISMMEGNRRFAKLLADSLGTTVGALQKLSAEGVLTAETIMKAATDPRYTALIDKQFEQIPRTFDEAMTKVRDTATRAIGAFDRGGQFSTMLYNFFEVGGEGADDLEQRFGEMGANVRAALMAIGEVWPNLQLSASGFFDFVAQQANSLRREIVGILNLWDGARRKLLELEGNQDGAAAGAAARFIPGLSPFVPAIEKYFEKPKDTRPLAGDMLEQRYQQNLEKTQGDLRARNRWNDLTPDRQKVEIEQFRKIAGRDAVLPSYMIEPTAPAPGVRGASSMAEDKDKPKAAPNPRRTAQQGMEAFIAEMKRRGYAPNAENTGGVFRTWDQQNNLFKSLPAGQAAKPGTSAHEFWRGADFKVNTPDRVIREAADAAGVDVARIKRHRGTGMHAHVELGDPGRQRNENDGNNVDAMVKAEQARLDALQQFGEQLDQSVKTARMLPEEAQKHADLMRLQTILFDGILESEEGLTAEEKAQYETMKAALAVRQQQLAAAQVEGALRGQLNDAQVRGTELERQSAIIRTAKLEDMDYELELDGRIASVRAMAIAKNQNLEEGVLKTLLDQLTTQERINAEKERTNNLIRSGLDVASQYGGAPAAAMFGGIEIAGQRKALDAAREARPDIVTQEIYENAKKALDRASWEASNQFVVEFGGAIDQLAGYFNGKIGGALGKVANVINSLSESAAGRNGQSGVFGAMADVLDKVPMFKGVGEAFSKQSAKQLDPSTWKGVSGSFGDFKGDLKNIFGKNGDLAQGLGNVMSKANFGAKMGGMVDGLFDAVGIKSSKTGAKIGGAIGNTIGGPIGGLVGSVIGGIGGGMLKKTKWGTSVVSSGLDTADSSGNSKGAKNAASGAAGTVGGRLNQIADALGVQLGSYNVSIGQYNDKWRVSTTGYSGKLKKSKSGVQDFGDDAEAAFKFAIKDAIKDGALKGLSAASDRVLRGAKDPQAFLNAVAQYESIGLELTKSLDPTKGAIDEFVKGMSKMREQLERAGYTAAELDGLEKLYVERRKELMKQLTEPFREFTKAITQGPDSGASIATQYGNAKSEFATYQDKLANGERVDQAEFTRVGQLVFDLSRQMFGSTTEQFATDRQALVDASNRAIDNIEAISPEEALKDAIDKAGAETVTSINTGNAILGQILGVLSGNANAGFAPSTNNQLASNDSFVGAGRVGTAMEAR